MHIFIHASFLFLLSSTISCLDISLSTYKNQDKPVVWDITSGKALCFPVQQAMAHIYDSAFGHLVQPIDNWDMTQAMAKIGDVLCRQLNLGYATNVSSISRFNEADTVQWAASCLGYEPQLSHCLFQQFGDLFPCQSLLVLECKFCHEKIIMESAKTVAITSPGFPRQFTNNIICVWEIEAGSYMRFSFNLWHMLLAERVRDNCLTSIIEIFDGNGAVKKSLCGFSKNETFNLTATSLVIRYSSGIYFSKTFGLSGFSLQISSEPLSPNEIIELKTNDSCCNTYNEVAKSIGWAFGGFILALALALLFPCLQYVVRSLRRQRSRRRMATMLLNPHDKNVHTHGANSGQTAVHLAAEPSDYQKKEDFDGKINDEDIYENLVFLDDRKATYLSFGKMQQSETPESIFFSEPIKKRSHTEPKVFLEIPRLRINSESIIRK